MYADWKELQADFAEETGEVMSDDAAKVMFDRYQNAEYERRAGGAYEANHCEKCGVAIDAYGTHCERHE